MAELHLLSPRGFRAAGVRAGIKSRPVNDVGLLVCDKAATAAAVFTQNKVVSPAVTVGRQHVASGRLRGVVVNSGNANACTGRRGLRDAQRMCELAGELLDDMAGRFLPSSTGIIGHHLPMEKVERGIHAAAAQLGDSEAHAADFADAILTTDLNRKVAAARFKLGRQVVTIAGVCKGSGMIGPRLGLGQKGGRSAKHATMLAYLTTDAAVPPAMLRRLMQMAAEESFNAVTVDDQMSTNDTAAILASGASGARVDSPRAGKSFASALGEVARSLAYQIAADGEGATKVVAVTVTSARSEADAREIARLIANSPLVKTAMHGNDPNWGRIICAAGMARGGFDPARCVLRLQGTTVFRAGQPVAFDAAALSERLKAPDVAIELSCGLGRAKATCWTCDLSREYITINADYHT